MSSFAKHYRPMNMAERQRRHDIKDLEAQVRESGVVDLGIRFSPETCPVSARP